jgi:hypothetical protein
LLVSPDGASMSRRDATRLVKTNNPTVQFNIQPIRGDRHLDDKGEILLVSERLTAAIK